MIEKRKKRGRMGRGSQLYIGVGSAMKSPLA
jgi:hypothetical protein